MLTIALAAFREHTDSPVARQEALKVLRKIADDPSVEKKARDIARGILDGL
jgi:hypothetical protein